MLNFYSAKVISLKDLHTLLFLDSVGKGAFPALKSSLKINFLCQLYNHKSDGIKVLPNMFQMAVFGIFSIQLGVSEYFFLIFSM